MSENNNQVPVNPYRKSLFFQSQAAKKVFTYMQFGLYQQDGFIVITGEDGIGKSSIIKHFVEIMIDDSQYIVKTISIKTTQDLNVVDLFLNAFDIEIDTGKSNTGIIALENFMRDLQINQKKAILIVDDAHLLNYNQVEELAILMQFQLHGNAIFNCYLVGTPDLKNLIQRLSLVSPSIQIQSSCTIETLTLEEMKHYIDWCFINAGWNSKKPRFTQDAYDKIYSITQGFMLPLSQFYKNTLSECTLKGKTKFTHEDVEEILNQLDIPKIHVSENVSKDQTKSFDIDFNSINVLYKEKNNSSIEQDVRVPILEKSNKDFKFDEDIISLKKENINQNISVEETIKDDIIKRMERIFLIMQEQDDKLQNLTNDALNKLSTLRIKNNQMPIFMSDNL